MFLLKIYLLQSFFFTGPLSQAQDPAPSRWEPDIAEFEKLDKAHPPPQDGILFIGSSSIKGWDLQKFFPGLPVINRGFGGSHIEDSTAFAHRILLPYRPRVIVLYAGDNDIASGKSAKQVARDFSLFVKTVRQELPQTCIVYIAIKPSIARWNLVEEMREANRLIQEMSLDDSRLTFVDIDRPMIGGDKRPRSELFAPDGLHLNEEGYELWAGLLRPHLQACPAKP